MQLATPTALALLLLLPPHAAQRRGPRPVHASEDRPDLPPLVLDLGTGEYSTAAKARRASSGITTGRSLSNLDYSGWFGVDSVGAEWLQSFDKGQGRTGGKSEIMTAFTIAYCGTSCGPFLDGEVTISFIEGYSSPALGTPSPAFSSRTAVYNLSGLPLNTASGCWFYPYSCRALTIRTATPSPSPGATFTGGQPLADGPMGWGWQFTDVDPNGGPLASTFPFLACVTSCSGPGPDGQTMTDGVDRYTPTGSGPLPEFVGTFTFGTASTYGQTLTSMAFEIREAEAIATDDALHNPNGVAGPNPVILTNLSPPVLGGTLVNRLDCSLASVSKPAVLRYEFQPGTVTPFTIPGAIGNVLVSLVASHGRNFVLPPHGMGAVQQSLPVPIDLQYLGLSYEVQGYCGDSPAGRLSNARIQTIGSP